MIKLLVGRLTKLPTHSVAVLGFWITTAISADDASFQLKEWNIRIGLLRNRQMLEPLGFWLSVFFHLKGVFSIENPENVNKISDWVWEIWPFKLQLFQIWSFDRKLLISL